MPIPTPLLETHRRLGARLMEFGGWTMPLQYAGIVEEHRAVRARAGLFDISHMGKVEVWGPRVLDFLQRVTANDVAKLAENQAQYSFLLDDRGGIVDDIIVYRLPERFLVVVNAGQRPSDVAWLQQHLEPGAALEDRTEQNAMLALQGPDAVGILQQLTGIDLSAVRYYRAAQGVVAGCEALVLRTGYTGEDGFEIMVEAAAAAALWEAITAAGAVQPCGLGARDTLRLEAGMALYGHELDRGTSPLETGLGRFVALEKPDFLGKAALLASRDRPRKRLIGFRMADRSVPRNGYRVMCAGEQIGTVTSGSYAPTLEAMIGMAYVPPAYGDSGRSIDIVIRDQPRPAVVVELPFYRRQRR